MKLEITTLDNGIKHVELTGRLDLGGSVLVDDQFTSRTIDQKSGVLVDMTNVSFMASVGMRLIISNAKELSEHGGKLVLFNPTPLVREVMATAGFDQLISIYDDFQTACEELLESM